ncbi:uncharacterized protein LOC144102094 [Amblyomma americanum]
MTVPFMKCNYVAENVQPIVRAIESLDSEEVLVCHVNSIMPPVRKIRLPATERDGRAPTGSVGAATAAMSGRGNRILASDSDYQVVLPICPTGRFVENTVFLHGDIRARPFRVEDFRDALAPLSLMPDVIALGAYRMNHVWAVTFKDADAVKKIVSAGDLQVKNTRCFVIDTANRDVRMKLHWLLHSVPDDDVRLAFAVSGKVTDISRERWRALGVSDKSSTTRLVTLKLNAGVQLDDLPHQVSVSGELALVVVPGRAPLCLRCRGTGHIRRECRIPRCGTCRRFGNEEGQCPRTYASVTGPGNGDRSSELYMDEADAEEATQAEKPAAVLTKPTLDVQVAAEPCPSVSTYPSLKKDAKQEESAGLQDVSKELTTED